MILEVADIRIAPGQQAAFDDIAAVEDPNPVLYIDDRWLYEQEDELPEVTELDLSSVGPSVLIPGDDITIVGSGYATLLAKQAAELLSSDGISPRNTAFMAALAHGIPVLCGKSPQMAPFQEFESAVVAVDATLADAQSNQVTASATRTIALATAAGTAVGGTVPSEPSAEAADPTVADLPTVGLRTVVDVDTRASAASATCSTTTASKRSTTARSSRRPSEPWARSTRGG